MSRPYFVRVLLFVWTLTVSCSEIDYIDNRIVSDTGSYDLWQKNCVDFAFELCQLRWTPIRPMPSSYFGFVADGTEDTNVIKGRKYYQPDVEMVGIPYSCAGEYGRNIGSDVRIETFMTALKNPNSIVYTLDTRDTAPSSLTSCYYGNNCSSFTNLLQNIPVFCFGRNCFFGGNKILQYPRDIDSAQVGDMIYLQKEVKDSGHAIIIIGITKEDGEVTYIRTAEESLHNAVIVDYTRQSFIDAFFNGGKGYVSAEIYRNNDIQCFDNHEVFSESGYHYSEDIGLNLGNNTNYNKSDTIQIEVTCFNRIGFDLIRNGTTVKTYTSTAGSPGYGSTMIINIDKYHLDCGFYEVRPSHGVSQFFCLADGGTINAVRLSDGSIVISSQKHSSNIQPYGVIFFSNSQLKTTRGMYEMHGDDTVIVPSEYMDQIDTYGDITYAMVAYRNEYGNVYSDKVIILNN